MTEFEFAERGREVIAFHEAGHTVAFLARGSKFEFVTIVEDEHHPDGDLLGHVHAARPWPQDIPFGCAAGPIAERHYRELIEYFDDYFDDVEYSDDFGLREHFDNVRLGIEMVKAYPDRFTIDLDDFTEFIESSNWVMDNDTRVKMWRLYERELTSPELWPAVGAVAEDASVRRGQAALRRNGIQGVGGPGPLRAAAGRAWAEPHNFGRRKGRGKSMNENWLAQFDSSLRDLDTGHKSKCPDCPMALP